jgi:chromosome segregation ATPase
MVFHIDAQNSQIETLNNQISHFETLLRTEIEKVSSISSEFENFKQTSSLSSSEQVNQLNAQIENLNSELQNLGLLFESTTNTLAETEALLESKTFELENSEEAIQKLHAEVNNLHAAVSEKEQSFEDFRSELESSSQQQLQSKEIEFQKLLAENTNLINEIDLAQDKVEAQEAEITLLKTELDEVRSQSIGRVEELKETLSSKNFEITNLQGTNAALETEISALKLEIESLRSEVEMSSQSNEQLNALQHNYEMLNTEKHNLLSEINMLQTTIGGLNSSVSELNEKISGYETELDLLRNSSNAEEQEAFIDRLFKQIDVLNDERLALLNEKEQMAGQLLKMNDVISGLSQEVDSQSIDVSSLNNHRKNVILASNSNGAEKSQMKKQINDLVREIDKCIALLSA